MDLTTHNSVGLPEFPAARRRDFGRGAYLVEAETAADLVYLIAEGQVRCFALTEDGCETTTAIVGPYQLVGFDSLVGRSQHGLFVEALTPVRAWAIPSMDLAERIRRDPDPALRGLLVGTLAQRLAFVQGLLRDVLLLTVRERLVNVQQRLQVTLRGETPALSRSRLAELIQARPETLTRIPRPRNLAPVQAMAAGCSERLIRFRAGERLSHVDPGAGFVYQVLEGRLQIALSGQDKRELTAQVVESGDFFGFCALVGMPSPGLKATATTDGTLRMLSAKQLLDEVASDRSTLQRLTHQLASNLSDIERQLITSAARSVRDRLLTELGARCGREPDATGPFRLGPEISHPLLARSVGCSRETITRALSALERDGIVIRYGKARASSNTSVRLAASGGGALKHMRVDSGEGSAATPFASIPIDLIDEPLEQYNTRATYAARLLNELAASIRQEGVLQPVSVRPEGERFRLIFGVRRLRAARLAGLTQIPCMIRVFEEDGAFVANLIENLHRQQLSGAERVRAIERLAATGLGVRAIARRTGFDASTISRWLRIGENPLIRNAVEQNQIDITRAKILVQVPKQELPSLLARAGSITVSELRARVGKASAATDPEHAGRAALELLRSIPLLEDERLLQALEEEVERLRRATNVPQLYSA